MLRAIQGTDGGPDRGVRDRADDRGALLRRLVIVACKGLLVVLVDACPESGVGRDVLLVGDAERLAGLVRVAGRGGIRVS